MVNSTEQQAQDSAAAIAESVTIVSRKEAKEKSLNRYFTGKPCKHGHICERFINGDCSKCVDVLRSRKDQKDRAAKYRSSNREDLCSKQKGRYYKNHEQSKDKAKDYRNNNKDVIKNWRVKNKDHISNYNNKYRIKHPLTKEQKQSKRELEKIKLMNPDARASRFIRQSISRILDSRVAYFSSGLIDLGYSKSDLVNHIESLWVDGMSWANHSQDGWHIDHIKSISSFIKEGVTDVKIINALSNLQPLWAFDNLSKGAK